jgi:hypothetical protein
VSATKQRYDADAAWELLKTASRIQTAKGKKIKRWNPSEDGRDAILNDVIGPSGNLRAPTWRIGREFLVGFNEALYAEVLTP